MGLYWSLLHHNCEDDSKETEDELMNAKLLVPVLRRERIKSLRRERVKFFFFFCRGNCVHPGWLGDKNGLGT